MTDELCEVVKNLRVEKLRAFLESNLSMKDIIIYLMQIVSKVIIYYLDRDWSVA